MANKRHYIAYNNSDDPEWRNYTAKPEGHQDYHWTRRKYREETLKGSQLWVIEGRSVGAVKQYTLRSGGEILRVVGADERPPWRRIYFLVGPKIINNDLTGRPWFKDLLKKAGNFGLGIVETRNGRVIAEFEELRQGNEVR